MEKVGDVHPQRCGHQQEVAQLHLGADLHPLHRAPVVPGSVGERLLGHVLMQPPHTDAVADGPAGVEDPLRLIGWHPTNRLPTMIISQQQI